MYLFTSEVVRPGHSDKYANINNSSLAMDGIGEFVTWYRKFYRAKN